MKATFWVGGFFLLLTEWVQAAQIIYIDPEFFEPGESKFILDAKKREDAVKEAVRNAVGNVWTLFTAKNALGGTAFGAPGDNDFNTNEPLVLRLPVDVKPGEAGPWKLWARLNKTEDPNSFYWRVSQDKKTWTPANFDINAAGWNNPPGFGGGVNPLVIKGKEPWFWFDGVGAPELKSGINYLSLSNRESANSLDVLVLNLIDVLCARNDGKTPTDEEATALLQEQYKGWVSPLRGGLSVRPFGKLAVLWGAMKRP